MQKNNKDLNTAFLGHPKPLFGLSLTEVWERFSFYGIRPLLILFMAAAIHEGGLGIDRQSASNIVGIFGGCLYLAALPGGWLADNFLGQKRAILIGAIIIALGHLNIALSFLHSTFFFVGLIFIVIGTGLFKTCASVMVGMLYDEHDKRRDSGFTIFYMAINLGAFIAPLVCGTLQKEYGYQLGFGAGGIGMLIAVIIFYFKARMDLKEFGELHNTKNEWEYPIKQKNPKILIYIAVAVVVIISIFYVVYRLNIIDFSPNSIAEKMVFVISISSAVYFLYLFLFSSLNLHEKKNLIVFVILFIAAVFFWSTFEQQPTSFNLFAQDFTNKTIFNFDIPTPWFQSLNPLFIIIFAPIIASIWIFLDKRNMEVSSIAKFGIGTLCAGIGFFIMMFASKSVFLHKENVSMLWIAASIFFMTIGELSLSPVGLSIMTKIAPTLIKSQVMGLWFVTTALGNVVAGLIGGEIDEKNVHLMPDVFFKLACMLLAVSIILFLLKNLINKMLKS